MINKPLAAPGLISYRAKGRYGFIMIGAKDDQDAYNEARRSTDIISSLEVWDGEKYTPVRLYHVVAINERTGDKTYMTDCPMPHHYANTNRMKFSHHPARRIQLEEVINGRS